MRQNTLMIVGAAIIVIAIGIFVSSSWKGSAGDSSTTSEQPAAAIVPFTKLTQGMQSKVSTRINYFITSSAQLAELWKIVNATGTPPKIDFATEAVIAVFAGEKPTTGYGIAVSKVEDSAGKRLVTITLMQPAPDCVTAQSITAPYEILKLPTTTLPLAHQDAVTTVNCPD